MMKRVISLSKRALLATAVSSLALLCNSAAANAYPDKPIRMIVPYTAGGGSDMLARLVAKELEVVLGQPIVVDNRGSAGGIVGQGAVARSAADGYTILFSGSGNLAISAVLFKSLPYDTLKDFTPIALVATGPMLVLVNENVQAKDFSALQKEAAAKSLSWSSGGVGTTSHLTGELVFNAAKTKILHVPYNGTAPSITGFRGKQVEVVVDTMAALAPFVDPSKGIRAIAQTGATRSELMADVPTMKELGYNLTATVWWGVLAPANLPEQIRQKLNAAVNKVLSSPALKDGLRRSSAYAAGGTSAEFGTFLAEEIKKWGAAAAAANVERQ